MTVMLAKKSEHVSPGLWLPRVSMSASTTVGDAGEPAERVASSSSVAELAPRELAAADVEEGDGIGGVAVGAVVEEIGMRSSKMRVIGALNTVRPLWRDPRTAAPA
eukprot:2067064-Pyramimonas_sp.AAC.1